jgi:hypothetical protein
MQLTQKNILAVCETVGELVVKDRKALILVQHWSDTDGIDILAIPTDWCTEDRSIGKSRRCYTRTNKE